MKKIFLLLIGLSLVSCSTFRFLHKLNKAQKLYLDNVSYVENILSGKEKPVLQDVKDLTRFFTDLTDIKLNLWELLQAHDTESGIVKNLKNWYENNKERLYWDEETQKVKLKS